MNSPMLKVEKLTKEEAEQRGLDTSNGVEWQLIIIAVKTSD